MTGPTWLRSTRRAISRMRIISMFGLLSLWAAGCASTKSAADRGSALAATSEDNRKLIAASFGRWSARTGGPFELLAENVQWTIVGSSPLSKTYCSRQHFMEEVINPFNARVAKGLMPTVRRIFSDDDTVIVLFDGEAPTKDGQIYRNTYAWFLHMQGGRIIHATAFFDTRLFDELWKRVSPSS